MDNYRYSKRCPDCKQFWKEGHICQQNISSNPELGVSWTEANGSAVLDGRFKRIVTLDQLLEMGNVDLSKWYVERYVINKWEVGAKDDDGKIVVEPLIQVKAWLKPTEKLNEILTAIKEAKDDLIAAGNKRDVSIDRNFIRARPDKDSCAIEMVLYDTHFGMYAWGEETRDSDYDIKIAKELYLNTCEMLLRRSTPYDVEEFILPIGNDGLHADGPVHGSKAGGATAAGTIMDMDTRFGKVFRTKKEAVLDAVEMLLTVAPVRVVVVGGNHDPQSSFMLGEIVDAYFAKDGDVIVDNSPSTRKYYRYGNTLIGWAHGKEEKPDRLPIIMATDMPDQWAQSTYREWHLGHLHRKEIDNKGVILRWMPSIVPMDAWASGRAFVSERAAEALIFHKEQGLIGTQVVKVPSR